MSPPAPESASRRSRAWSTSEPGRHARDTSARVQEAIDALGFRRNDSARVLRKGRTASIGLVLEDLADPFYGPLSRAVEEVARAHGALLINGSSAEDPDREQELVLALCARRVDGLVVIPAGDDHRYLEPEIKAGVATVFVDRPAGQIDADCVLSRQLRRRPRGRGPLIAHGHRRIGFIGDMPRIHTAAERLRGYRAAMEDAGHPVEDAWMSLGATDPAGAPGGRGDALRPRAGHRHVRRQQPGDGHRGACPGRAGPRRSPWSASTTSSSPTCCSPGVTVVAQDAGSSAVPARRPALPSARRHRRAPKRVELPARLIPRGSGELPPVP